ncbi:MAG: hypothetical protein JO087_11600 [Actinobacteria bacterium]|nr:hypothetical protein [Actinomycetota bacterium]
MGAWAARFRFASAACCAAVAVLLVTGVVAGVTYSSPVANAKLPHGAAAYQRAQQLFSGGSLFAAVLLVAAVLLIAVTDAEEDRAKVRPLLRASTLLAGLVAAFAIAMTAVTIWYAAVTSGRGIVSATTGLVGELVTVVIVAATAAWWATRAAATK